MKWTKSPTARALEVAIDAPPNGSAEVELIAPEAEEDVYTRVPLEYQKVTMKEQAQSMWRHEKEE